MLSCDSASSVSVQNPSIWKVTKTVIVGVSARSSETRADADQVISSRNKSSLLKLLEESIRLICKKKNCVCVYSTVCLCALKQKFRVRCKRVMAKKETVGQSSPLLYWMGMFSVNCSCSLRTPMSSGLPLLPGREWREEETRGEGEKVRCETGED